MIDLTLDEADEEEEQEQKESASSQRRQEIPYEAFLPIGVDVTDDVVHIDSDSENEQNIAEADYEALQRQRQQLPKQQGKFQHTKAIQAAARKRKRKLAEEAERKRRRAVEIAEQKRVAAEQEAAEKRRRTAEEAERRRKRTEETRERKRLQRERHKLELQQKRKAEAEALRKNPPLSVNFVIIDSDPEEDLSTSRNSPLKNKAPAAHRFHPIQRTRTASKCKRQKSSSSIAPSASAATTCAAASAAAPASPGTSDSDRPPLERAQRPYQNAGSDRVEFTRPRHVYRFNEEFDYDYKTSRNEAQADQERLFREAAETMRQLQQQQERGTSVMTLSDNLYGPTFSQVITNVHEQYPLHWTWKDPYACLGLPPNAPVSAAKSQYRILVRRYHPDKSKQANTSTKFHAVVLAFNKVRQRQPAGATHV